MGFKGIQRDLKGFKGIWMDLDISEKDLMDLKGLKVILKAFRWV